MTPLCSIVLRPGQQRGPCHVRLATAPGKRQKETLGAGEENNVGDFICRPSLAPVMVLWQLNDEQIDTLFEWFLEVHSFLFFCFFF